MIKLECIAKTFGSIIALKDINLSIAAAQTTVLIGPSGCGKSTLLRLIIGLIDPDGGSCYFDNSLVNRQTIFQIRKRIGYVIQEGGLFPHLTIINNAALMAQHLKWDRDRIMTRLDELADLTQFPKNRWNYYPIELSGGQRQRVSLMRALMLDPDVLLFDEPLAALDPMIRSNLQKDLKAVFQDLKKTVVMVTHDIGEAAYFGDHIVLMRKGEIVQAGSIQSLLQSPAIPFVTQFINAQRNPLDITLRKS